MYQAQKFIVVRVDDDRSSIICRRIEEKALQEGGITFPLFIDERQYGLSALERGLKNSGSYRTGLFHDNCRCSLVPVTDSMSNLIREKGEIDELDQLVLLDSAIAHTADQEFKKVVSQDELSVGGYIKDKVNIKLKQAVNYVRGLFK